MAYTAVVLTEESRAQVLGMFGVSEIPAGWEIKAHHMTCDLKPAAKSIAADMIGQTVDIEIVSLGLMLGADSAGIMALGVECAAPSKNAVKHITVAHHATVKPKMSNDIVSWTPVANRFTVQGVVQEVA